MGKRSSFPRRKADAYQTTDPRAVKALMPFLFGVNTFAEPCCGEGKMVEQLEAFGLSCCHATDICYGTDALDMKYFGFPDAIITNPPWSRHILHPMIMHFMHSVTQVWLLFDSDWAHTVQAAPYLNHCSHIVAVGRMRWIENTKHSSKDNVSWYRFARRHDSGPHFYGRIPNGHDSE